MERAKKTRATLRASFTKYLKVLDAELEKNSPDKGTVLASFKIIEDKRAEIAQLDEVIFEAMLDKDVTEDELSKEQETVDDYKVKVELARVLITEMTQLGIVPQGPTPHSNDSAVGDASRKFKLPQIELKKFNGDPKQWLQFWSIFNKIHVDTSISDEEKFHYLIQAMVENSRASEIVNSYPPTAENYKKAIESLKSRFGRNDLLVEVYVRELLKLVLNKSKGTITSIYDKLETHLRSLESLGVTKNMCAAMLFPLVESSLPEDILRAWQRTSTRESEAQKRLESLMKFLEGEVHNEERISMAKEGFEKSQERNSTVDKVGKKAKQAMNDANASPNTGFSTAAGLLSNKEQPISACIFCSELHASAECEKARSMPLNARQAVAKEKRVCFACLKPNHSAKKCKTKCKCTWCGQKHVLLMCRNVGGNNATTEADAKATKSAEDLTASCNTISSSTRVYLQTLRVKIKGPSGEKTVRALIDSGSHQTYVLESVAQKLGLVPTGKHKMVHLLFGGERTDPREHNKYQIRLVSLDGGYECVLNAFSEELICQQLPAVTPGPWIDDLKRAGIIFTDSENTGEPISLLIGADVVDRLYTGEIHRVERGPSAFRTKLGWTLMGRNDSRVDAKEDNVSLALSMYCREADVSDLWRLDVIGVMDPVATQSKAARLTEIKSNFEETIRVNARGRYEVCLPWKENHPPLSDNRLSVEKRLHALTKRLKSEQLYEEYEQVFDSWLQAGIIEQLPLATEDSGYYLPHRHVVKENSTTRIRPVFDASASSKGSPSLNECLETGPNLIELITDILLRFRRDKIGVTADIKGAFLQISVNPTDRHCLKFLWWSKEEPRRMIVYQHCRVVFGVNSSPFLLGATIEHHLNAALMSANSPADAKMIEKLKSSFYVDNCVASVSSYEEMLQFQEKSKQIMQQAGFELRGWEHTGLEGEENVSSVLGISWDRKEDVFSLRIDTQSEFSEPVTKRRILSTAHKVFDPFGWACPAMLLPKLMLQELWNLQISWDAEVPGEVRQKFERWYEKVHLLQDIKVPRWIFGSNDSTLTFHVFVDASRLAYAAIVFVAVETDQIYKVSLVQAKSRIGPNEKISIPRMELLAATLGARLADSVLKALDIGPQRIIYWSDSTTVLSWLQRNCQWNKFVWNRVEEIKKLSDVAAWRHVPGEMNPADLPSRGCSIEQLVQSKWWQGPDWLRNPDLWPPISYVVDENQVNLELPKSQQKLVGIEAEALVSQALISHVGNDAVIEEPLWYMKNFSRYDKLVRSMAWVIRFLNIIQAKLATKKAWTLRFVNIVREKIASRKTREKSKREVTRNLEKGEFNVVKKIQECAEITAQEYENAERKLFKLAQEESFSGVDDPRLQSLNVYEDNMKLIRTVTLISNRADTFDFRHPVVLDGKHAFTRLLVEYTHRELNHASINTTVSALRERVWITSIFRTVRSVKAKCVTCRRQSEKGVETPPASLPEDRVRDAAVFEIIGVDYAGPVYLRDQQKCWICLFTCAVFRAVHLELVTSLSTQAFLNALRRFIARRGRPAKIYSDNGTNFVGASNLLKSVSWKSIQRFCTVRRIEWQFIPPSSPWWGGWWERLIRIMKDLLKRTLGRALLSHEEMTTILYECEAVINARPISQPSGDQDKLAALRPDMFLKDNRSSGVPDLDQLDKVSHQRLLKYRERLRKELKDRFRSEYLGQLSRHAKTRRSNGTIEVGDVVLIGNDTQKRVEWPLGLVLELIPGRDGISRIARVKTANGELIRPLQRLIVLENSKGGANLVDRIIKKPDQIDQKDSTCKTNKINQPRKIDDIQEDKPQETQETQETRTRSGRLVRAPKRL